MTPPAEPADDLPGYRRREEALYAVREAVEATDTWEDFVDHLENRNLPEARLRQIIDPPVPMDLHLHSTASDGMIPPRKLAWVARVMGLETLALTDHDCVGGCRELYSEAMLLGLSAIPGVELSTERAGLEILLYWPDAGRFFDFLTTPRGRRFAGYLERQQEAIHEVSLKVLGSVNRWLAKHDVPAEARITEEELDDFFGGREPYFPGPLCVLGLKRLDEKQRKELGIRDPRTFNTKVVSPALKRYGALGSNKTKLPEAIADVRKVVASVRRSPAGAVAILSHPKELLTKGKLSIGQVAETIRYLVGEIGLDGVEVGCARDTEADVEVWTEIVHEINGQIAAGDLKAPGPLLVASYSSDFHVLGPGTATGEITLGFGLLDERRGHRRGNLRPQTTPDQLLEVMRRRAAVRATD